MSLRTLVASWAKPIVAHVPGAPYQVGNRVRVTRLVDETADETHIGAIGSVEYLEYSCGCGQTYPADPMVGVRMASGAVEEFWAEEIAMGIWNDDEEPTCGDDCGCASCITIAQAFTLALAGVEEILDEPTRSVDVRLLALEVLGHSEEQAELAEMMTAAGEHSLAALHRGAAVAIMGDAERLTGGAS